MKTRIIILLSLVMCLFFAFSASAEVVDSGICGDNLTWTFDDNGTLTISGTGDMYDWDLDPLDDENIPWNSYIHRMLIKNVIIETGVTSIGRAAFYRQHDGPEMLDNSIVSVSIPNSVTSIGERAFAGCNNLKAIVIPDSVTSIGERAFAGCDSLTSVKIGNGVTSIGERAFTGCDNLKEIFISDSVTNIGNMAFAGCTSLKTIIIPASVTSLERYHSGHYYDDDIKKPTYDSSTGFGSEVFDYCTSLESIYVDENNEMYSNDENGVLYNKDKTVLIRYPAGNKATSYEIPDSVTIIGDDAFKDCTNLEEIIIPNGVTTIGGEAFANCIKLEAIVIPDSVISVGGYAFEDCTNLKSAELGNNFMDIKASAFDGCTYLVDIKVNEYSENYSKDERGVLFNKEKTILIKYPVETEETSYVIPDGVTEIGNDAFKGCTSLEEVSIPDGVTRIGHSAFEYCRSLKAIVIPDSVVTIGSSAFRYCVSLKAIEIPDSVIRIGDFAFYYCTNLKNVTIGNSVTSIGFEAFIGFIFDHSTPVIYGYKGSTAETAAKENNRPFVALSATPTNAKVLINGKEVAFTAYNIGGNNYFKLRDVAMALDGSEKNFNVGWDAANNAVSLTSNQSYIPVGGELVVDVNAAATEPVVTNSKIFKDGELITFAAFNIGGNNYFKLRDIGKAFDFGIGWDNETKTIAVDTSTGYTE